MNSRLKYEPVRRLSARATISVVLSFTLALIALAGARGQSAAQTNARRNAQQPQSRAQQSQRPRLVVLVVVDQFRADYL